MEQESEVVFALVVVPPRSDMQDMLTLMNTARIIYLRARSREVKKLADRHFNHCYDWFVRHQISIS